MIKMTDIALNAEGEIVLEYADLALVEGTGCLLQDIKTRLMTDIGVLFYDTAKTIPQITNYHTGGVFRLFIETVAAFIFHIYTALNSMLPNIFTQTASGSWLDRNAEQLGLSRTQAKAAEGLVIFSRKDTNGNITIAKDKVVATKTDAQGCVFRYRVKETFILEDGSASISVPVLAENSGSAYNVLANQITEIVTPIPGIDSVSNNSDWLTVIGLDSESDESLRARCLAKWEGLSGADASAYVAWARQIPGVENVMPISTARGLGTVDVVITGTGNIRPSEAIIAEAQKIIDANNPIGTDVQVKAPREILINPVVNVTEESDAFADKAEIEALITEFFKNISIGKDFEPSELIAVVFRAKNIKAVAVVSPGAVTITQTQIARIGNLSVEVLNA
ncbi:Uncharacterized phage protein gp47/JayE [Brevinema andersonii]|uniref:Uncharacterized phage protein gp47/JayE n=1 Tax=Brevinema andersonii TaxID=34097 RepID=A0A1I1FFJ9_BREAD|nr:baseplate J/gp47 family protein [Brevinema andersonii]SFB95903.1 Uncharacterized phage protein gp47/JayE [Brevinema andersonii]